MDWAIKNYWLWILAALVVGIILARLLRRKMKRGADIVWPSFPENLSWKDEASTDASLSEIYKYAVGFSNGSVTWYQERRRPKRTAGYLLRVAAIVATFLAGLVPLSQNLGLPEIYPHVSTVLLALAALLISIDNFGGYTSGWVRYMLAQQKIERARDAFLMEWNALQLASVSRHEKLERAKVYLLSVGKIVDEETQEWATEFQNALKELERARKAEAESPRTGALEITIKNAQGVDGWTLEIDGNLRGQNTGKAMAISDVAIGQRKIRVSGKTAAGKVLSDEKIVKIEGGMTSTREFELN